MFSTSKLRLHIMQDEVRETFDKVQNYFTSLAPKRHNKIGVLPHENENESKSSVWVEVGVGNNGLKLRVAHLHPANPTVAQAISKKLNGIGDDNESDSEFIPLPSEDEISIASMEDYWFNHWQGPHITADNNQNSFNIRYSKRSFLNKSHRKLRCSICQKKIYKGDIVSGENVEPHYEGEGSIITRIPSVRPEVNRSGKGDDPPITDDDNNKTSNNEDSLSRYSASDEQLARVNRVLDNEMRTSFTLFTEGAVEQDVLDGVCMSVGDNAVSPDSAGSRTDPLSPVNPRQCRSCPCSPKFTHRNHSPESTINNSKSHSHMGSSKFSLSSSLLALHRQASNTLRPDFLKFDLGKSDSVSNFKNSSNQNSLKSNSHKAHKASFNDSGHDKIQENLGTVSPNQETRLSSHKDMDYSDTNNKRSVQETQSLPALKLTKKSISYKSSAIITKESDSSVLLENNYDGINKDGAISPTRISFENSPARLPNDDHTLDTCEGACALPLSGLAEDSDTGSSLVLPDVVPRCDLSISQESPILSSSESPFCFNPKMGVVNLGFDGQEESSDFTENLQYEASPINNKKNTKNELCVFESVQPLVNDSSDKLRSNQYNNSNLSTYDVVGADKDNTASPTASQQSSRLTTHTVEAIVSNEENSPPRVELKDSDNASVGTNTQSVSSTSTAADGSTIPVSSLRTSPNPSIHLEQMDEISCHKVTEDAGPQPVLPTGLAEIQQELERDPMSEARAVVYWWQRPATDDELEFCLHQTECKVKQKPLLLFLHGLGGSSDMWKQQLWYFVSCGYEVVAPDLLGHGLSSAPDSPSHYTFAQMLQHITLVFDLFVPHGRKCVVVGHGYGCVYAAALARGRPLNVKLIVLASCGGPAPLVSQPPGSCSIHSILAAIVKPFIALGCGSREFLYTPRGKHFSAQLVSGTDITPTPRYVINHVVAGQDWPDGDVTFHRNINVPALLLYGMRDTKVHLVEMCEMERTIPRAFLEVIPGAGHDLMIDAALDVCHSMHRFIKRWKHYV